MASDGNEFLPTPWISGKCTLLDDTGLLGHIVLAVLAQLPAAFALTAFPLRFASPQANNTHTHTHEHDARETLPQGQRLLVLLHSSREAAESTTLAVEARPLRSHVDGFGRSDSLTRADAGSHDR